MSEGVHLRTSLPIEATMMAELEGYEGASQFPTGCNVTEAAQGFKKGFD